MERTTIESLSREAEELRTRIDKDSSRLSEIEAFLQLAKKLNVATTVVPIATQLQNVTDQIARASRRPQTIKERILDGAEMILADGRRRLSRDIVRDLAKLGVIVGGSDSATNLASYLSREKDRFESDVKAGGWALKQLTRKRKHDETGTTSGNLFDTPDIST